MPGMPSNVSKGTILARFDQYCNEDHDVLGTPTRGARVVLNFYNLNPDIDDWLKAAERDWETEWPVGGSVMEGILIENDKDRKHVEKHWFAITRRRGSSQPEKRNQRKAWWPELHRMDRVLKPGLKRALQLCLYVDGDTSTTPRINPLPIDSYWICAGEHHEVVSMVSANQVTLLICTPSPTFSRRAGTFATPAEKIWITRSGGVDHGEVEVEATTDGVVTVQPMLHRISDIPE